MLADLYVPGLSNDMNITIHKNLGIKFGTEVSPFIFTILFSLYFLIKSKSRKNS